MDLPTRLKNETRDCHDEIEQAALFQKIKHQQITLNEYIHLLKKIYGFISPVENTLSTLAIKKLSTRFKSHLVSADLKVLTNAHVDLTQLHYCSALPLCTLENALGYLYVMEGSTLGGQVLTQTLCQQLGISPQSGCSYFYSYGKAVGSMWQEFCYLLKVDTVTLNQNSIIASAKATFRTFYHWLETD